MLRRDTAVDTAVCDEGNHASTHWRKNGWRRPTTTKALDGFIIFTVRNIVTHPSRIATTAVKTNVTTTSLTFSGRCRCRWRCRIRGVQMLFINDDDSSINDLINPSSAATTSTNTTFFYYSMTRHTLLQKYQVIQWKDGADGCVVLEETVSPWTKKNRGEKSRRVFFFFWIFS